MRLSIKRGTRAIIAGKTGSGKTRAALYLLHFLNDYPCYIFDTKIEKAFTQILGKTAQVVDGIADYDPLTATKPFIILRPTAEESTSPELIDSVIYRIHNAVEGCCIYIDEAYQVHINGRAGPGLTGLLTRGRSRDQTAIISTQRPVWISRFCLTESDDYFIFRLSDLADRKRFREVIADDAILNTASKYHFWHYNNADDEAEYFAPFPLKIDDRIKSDIMALIDGQPLAEKRKKGLRII
jgi:energy-coupling factor transporter ATP-binding protein EcfA2